MATYKEIDGLMTNDDLRIKISVAALIKAQAYLDGATPSANELNWASKTLLDPLAMGQKLIGYVLAANKSATVAQISNATDAAIQTNVNAAVDKLVAGGVI